MPAKDPGMYLQTKRGLQRSSKLQRCIEYNGWIVCWVKYVGVLAEIEKIVGKTSQLSTKISVDWMAEFHPINWVWISWDGREQEGKGGQLELVKPFIDWTSLNKVIILQENNNYYTMNWLIINNWDWIITRRIPLLLLLFWPSKTIPRPSSLSLWTAPLLCP